MERQQEITTSSNKSTSRFRGFGDDVSYIPIDTTEGNICKACPNLCQLHYIEVPASNGKTKRLIYGDACDRFQKDGVDYRPEPIEDLIAYRQILVEQDYPLAAQAESLKPLNKGRKIGIAKGLQYWTDFPFWNTFLRSLGLEIVLSKPNNPNTFDNVDSVTNIDSCVPLKMYYELVGDLIDREDVTDIYLPSIYNLIPLHEEQGKSQMCPLVSGINHNIRVHYSNLGKNVSEDVEAFTHNKRLIAPELFFDARYADKKNRLLNPKLLYGRETVVLTQLIDFASKEFNVSKKHVKVAYEAARNAQRMYVSAKRQKGREVLAELEQKQEHAIVLLGRSYNSFDKTLNMKLDTEIRKLNWQVIPFDFLPLETVERTKSEYKNNNWFFQGNLLAGAEIIKKNPLLHGIYISNFKCGADGFILHDMERVLYEAGKLMVLEIDDLINATGYRTRIEAYIRSISLANQRTENAEILMESKMKAPNLENSLTLPKRYTEKDFMGNKVMIPFMSDHSFFMAGAMRAYGIESTYFPPMTDKEMEVGRAHSNGKECLPFTITAGEILSGLEHEVMNGEDPNRLIVMWMITEGPCRFNQYAYVHQYNIDQKESINGAKIINLVKKNSKQFNAYTPGARMQWNLIKGFAVGDYMQQIMHQNRPYEIHTNDIIPVKQEYLNKIKSIEGEDMSRFFPKGVLDGDLRNIKLMDMIYQVYVRKVADVLGDQPAFEAMVKEYLAEVEKIPKNTERKRPLIGLVGEIYLRLNPYSNGDLIRQLEMLGAEVHLAPIMELIFYGTKTLNTLGDSLFGGIVDTFRWELVRKIDDKVFALFEDSLSRPEFGRGRDVKRVVEFGRGYTGSYCAGEGPLTLGAIEEYARHGAHGMIMIGPMGCLPNITFKGMFESVRDHLPDEIKEMPRMEITVSESLNFKNVLTRIEPFVNQAKDYMIHRPFESH
ncbi:MAG: hypothetical protein INQ03_13890 [Candidatus Heimdallarchaeota archaeon]|nr:hypothetical protein [Candidatus Heimdallarchaeota archaeon]